MVRRRVARGGRSGITLIEVMFSIGIVVIGVLGIISLIPLAAWQAKQGLIADEMATVGQSALHEFRLRRMNDPSNWLNAGGAFLFATASFDQDASYCIDPLFVAQHGAVHPTYDPSLFPYYPIPSNPGTAHPRMNRITVFPIYDSANTAVQNRLLAEQVFIWQDDLRFIMPDDETLPPVQQFNWSPGPDGAWGDVNVDDDNNGVPDDASEAGWGWNTSNPATDDFPINRASAGEMSWMATLTPKLEEGAQNDEYVLSIVVFHQRDLAIDSLNEQFLDVQLTGGGYTGGDVELSSKTSKEDLDELREGDWIMLAAYTVIADPDPMGTVKFGNPFFRWYKVLSRDSDIVGSAPPYTLNATLSGPDWTRPEWINNQVETVAIFMPQVVGVYERTIRLKQGSTLWNP